MQDICVCKQYQCREGHKPSNGDSQLFFACVVLASLERESEYDVDDLDGRGLKWSVSSNWVHSTTTCPA